MIYMDDGRFRRYGIHWGLRRDWDEMYHTQDYETLSLAWIVLRQK